MTTSATDHRAAADAADAAGSGDCACSTSPSPWETATPQ